MHQRRTAIRWCAERTLRFRLHRIRKSLSLKPLLGENTPQFVEQPACVLSSRSQRQPGQNS
jgi:hypothetical protein